MVSLPVLRRRFFLAAMLACGLGPARTARAEARRFRIALADLDETPGATLEGLGFTGYDLRRSFELSARTLPVDMLYFDNAGDPARAVANAEAAIAAKVDLLIEYNADAEANAEIARRLVAAAIPALALVDPLPGAPFYGPDNRAAGRIAGRALGAFARETWPDEHVLGVLIGDLAEPSPAISDRVRGITEGIHESLPSLSSRRSTPADNRCAPTRYWRNSYRRSAANEC
jgi:ABC-type sugar transport system substrate-binding protein